MENRRPQWPPIEEARRASCGVISRSRWTVSSPARTRARRTRSARAAGGKDVMLGGGADVARQYLAAGLLGGLELHVVPGLLGEGARLLDKLGDAKGQLGQVRAVEGPGGGGVKYRTVT